MASFISFNKIGKKINKQNILADLSFGVQKNEIISILGPSNSGKSILFELFMGIIEIDKGDIFVDGMSFKKRMPEILSLTGYLPQNNIFDDNLTISENLYFYGQLRGISLTKIKKEIEDWSKVFSFEECLDLYPNLVCSSNLRIISFARLLIGNPDILLLDNPTLGLDKYNRQKIWQIIEDFNKQKTIIFITQDFKEAELYSDRIVILNNGNIIINGVLKDLEKSVNSKFKYRFIFKRIVPHKFLNFIKEEKIISKYLCRDNYFEFIVSDKRIFFKLIKMALEYELTDIKFETSKLNNIFDKATQL